MDVTLLVSIIVCLHVVFQQASSAESPHPPTLSVLNWHPTYFEGEWVQLICSAPPNWMAEGYRFFNQSGGQVFKTPAYGFQQSKLTFNVQMDSSGNYTCDYWTGSGDTMVISAQSNTISLQVKEAPTAPFLTLDPSLDAYNREDTISIICSAPSVTQKITEFQYYGERQATSVVASSPICTYNLSLEEPYHVGQFSCAYVLQHSGRHIVSKKSNLVFINVTNGVGLMRMLLVGGSFFTINSLIFVISHWFF